MEPYSRSIIQWNINGLKPRHVNGELLRLLNLYNPIAICLQHTNYDLPNIGNYYRVSNFNCQNNELGTAIYINKKASCNPVSINDNCCQMTAIELVLEKQKTINLYNMYNQPNKNYNLNAIKRNIKHSKNLLLVGDLNAHSPLWDIKRITADKKGKTLEKYVDQNNLCILNHPEASTYFSRTHGTHSSVDITICSADIVHKMNWSVLSDDYTSDHYPVLISIAVDTPNTFHERFNVEKADWTKFSLITNAVFPFNPQKDHNITNQEFTDFIIEAAKKSMPLTKGAPPKKSVPWWNKDLKQLCSTKRKIDRRIQQLNNKYKELHQNQNESHKLNKLVDIAIELKNLKPFFNRICAKVKKEIKLAKETSWQKYVSTITDKTPMKKIWKKFKKINSSSKSAPKHPLKHKGKVYHDDKDIANILGSHLEEISSNNNYEESFKKIKEVSEKQKICFKTKESLYYNVPFTMSELNHALKSCRSSAPGADQIHFDMIKNLGPLSKEFLLKHYNNLWTKEIFPDKWRHALVIPIVKASKDPSDPQSYRPISLTSSLCKLMEKIVNARLAWYLKKNKIITKTQYGSLKNRSTMDSVTSIEHYIRKNFQQKKITAAVFFDIEKAYDRTWKHHVNQIMKKSGLLGHLPIFINNFLKNRTFQVRYNNATSSTFQLVNGIPQGSVLSSTLFLLSINPIVQHLPKKVKNNLYVDDFGIYYAGRHLRHLQRVLNGAIKAVYQWAKTVGLRFALTKTQGILFYRDKRWLKNQNINLKIGDHKIEIKRHVKFLGLYFDSHMNWKKHVAYIKGKAVSAINLIKKLTSTKWGAKRKMLMVLFKVTVLSIINYCSPVYSSASFSVLKALNTVQTQGIRLCTGAFRSSPINSILCEAGEVPLSLQREQTTMKHALKILESDAPTRKIFTERSNKNITLLSRHCISFPMRAKQLFERNELEITAAHRNMPEIPPWLIKPTKICLGLQYLNKKYYHPEVMKQHVNEHMRRKGRTTPIFTDGSKTKEGVGFAIHTEHENASYSLHPDASIFTAEMMAIMYSTLIIKKSNATHFTIYTDSRSSIEALANYEHKDSLVKKTKILLHKLSERGKHAELCWIPSHIGVKGNETVDEMAKRAITQPRCNETIPLMDHMNKIKQIMKEKWQQQWQQEPNRNKLKELKETVNEWPSSTQPDRTTETTLTRLRIGHTKMTHGYLMTTPKEPVPICETCNEPITIKHVLSKCTKYTQLREQHFGNRTYKEILSENEKFSILKLTSFLKKSKLLDQI